ncbi:MAG: hypothetical protein LBV52_06515 [Spirochaetaceae bacterium]|jgi:ABC-type antimicrobial peptide transport system permease subunit|nr:hypothetical protein [Spirochaetaceae bacterium]
MKKIYLCVLIFGISAYCFSEETYSDVTDLEQLMGKWMASYEKIYDIENAMEIFDIPTDDWIDETWEFYKDIKAVVKIDVTMNCYETSDDDEDDNDYDDNDEYTNMQFSESKKFKIEFSGKNINVLWDYLKSHDFGNELTFNDADYSITMEYNSSPVPIYYTNISSSLDSFKINKDRTKLKMDGLGFAPEGLIFIKQK